MVLEKAKEIGAVTAEKAQDVGSVVADKVCCFIIDSGTSLHTSCTFGRPAGNSSQD